MDSRSVGSGHTYIHSSPYSSIPKKNASKNNINKAKQTLAAIPPFLRPNDKQKYSFSRQFTNIRQHSPDQTSPKPIHRHSNSFKELLYERNNAINSTSKRLDYQDELDDYSDFISVLLKTVGSNVVMRISDFQVTADDFLSLIGQGPLTRKIIDACLAMYKHHNSEKIKESEGMRKVIIASTGFSWQIFNSKNQEKLETDERLLDYECILFPIYIGNWSLLVVDTVERVVMFYDANKSETYTESILKRCFKFLYRECLQKYNDDISKLNEIKTLRYINYDIPRGTINDPTLNMLSIVEWFSLKEKIHISSSQDDISIDKSYVQDSFKMDEFTSEGVNEDFKKKLARMIYDLSEKLI